MITAPLPPNETERLADLRALSILDTPPERRFDRIVALARALFHVPIAYIALIDANRQWFKAKCGLTVDQTGREVSFCGHAIVNDGPLIVPDATMDDRFADNPLVTGEPYTRFYAGFPLRGPGGFNVGTLCIADQEPRTLTKHQVRVMGKLAELAEHELNMLETIGLQRELLETQRRLAATQQRLADELNDAAKYVRSMLPPRLDTGPVLTDYQFICSSQLGGDFFGYHKLDEQRTAVYLLDVCGHGVGPSLLSISIHNALRGGTLAGADPADPSQVLAALNRAFPMEQHDHRFFTIWYGVYDAGSRRLHFAGGGHPPALAFENGSNQALHLGGANQIIGIMPDVEFKSDVRTMPPGSRMYLYSDGAFEVRRPNGKMIGLEGLEEVLADAQSNRRSRVDHALHAIQSLQRSNDFSDDFSLLEVEFA